jgi:hypothetical protein
MNMKTTATKPAGVLRHSRLGIILNVVRAHAWELCRAHFGADDCCIGATRALVRVFSHYGIEARALPVQAIIRNAQMVAALEAGEAPPPGSTIEEIRALARERGMRWIDLGTGRSPAGRWATYAAHLVAALPKHGILVDPTISQANRTDSPKIELPVRT